MDDKKNKSLQLITDHVNYNHDFRKRDAKKAGTALGKNVVDSGEYNLLEVVSNITRLKEVLTAAEANIKESEGLFKSADNKESWNGVEFSVMNTGDKLDYAQDPVFKELEDKAKDRKEKLKQAYKSYQKGGEKIFTEGYDEETGEIVAKEVPIIPIKTVGKQLVKIQY